MSVAELQDKIEQQKKELDELRDRLVEERRSVFFNLPLHQAHWQFGRSNDWQAFLSTDDEALVRQAQQKMGYEGTTIVAPLSGNEYELEMRLGETQLCVVAEQGGIDALPEVLEFGNDQELPPHFPTDEESFDEFVEDRFQDFFNSTVKLPQPETDETSKRRLYSFVPALQRKLDELLRETLDGKPSPEMNFTGTEPLAGSGSVRMDFEVTAEQVDAEAAKKS